ncbi:MAG: hypothetical protein ACRD96_23140, partial [Bryobacteraceae bacterium]
MPLRLVILLFALSTAWSQQKRQTFKEYCWDHPQMPSCKDGGFSPHSRAIERGFEIGKPKPPASPMVLTNPRAGESTVTRRSSSGDSPTMVATSVTDWRFAHPNATLLVAIKVGALLESPLAPLLMAQIYTQLQTAGLPHEKIEEFRVAMREVDQISVSVRTGTPTDGLILLAGRLQEMHGLLRGKAHRLAGGGLLLGAPASVSASVRRMAGAPVAAWSPVFGSIRDLDAGSDFWIAGTGAIPVTDTLKSALGSSSVTMLSSVRGFAFGMMVRNGAKLDLTVNTATPAAADRLLAEYRKFEAKDTAADGRLEARATKLDSGLRLRIEATQS